MTNTALLSNASRCPIVHHANLVEHANRFDYRYISFALKFLQKHQLRTWVKPSLDPDFPLTRRIGKGECNMLNALIRVPFRS